MKPFIMMIPLNAYNSSNISHLYIKHNALLPVSKEIVQLIKNLQLMNKALTIC